MNTHRARGEGRRNREIGLVRKKEPVTTPSLDPWKQAGILKEFEDLKKTLFVAQNQDEQWKQERNEISTLVKLIEERRVVLGLMMHLQTSREARSDLNRFLVEQKNRLDLLRNDTNKHYLLEVDIKDIPQPFLF